MEERFTQKLITGRDHNVRRAAVCVIDNQGKIITLKRNCKHLNPLELAKNIAEDDYSCSKRGHHSKKYGLVTRSMVTRWGEYEN